MIIYLLGLLLGVVMGFALCLCLVAGSEEPKP